jgi:hypothetical protein
VALSTELRSRSLAKEALSMFLVQGIEWVKLSFRSVWFED